MRKFLLISAAVAALVAWAGSWNGGGAPTAATVSSSPAVPADSASARLEVDAGNARFVKAWKTGDAELFAGCFAEDGALLHQGRPAVVGRDKIRDRMAKVFARYRMSDGEITTVDLFVLGDTAYETGRWRFAIGEIGGKPADPDSGRFVEVWKHTGEGWRMWRDIGVP